MKRKIFLIVFGLIISLFISELVLRLGGYIYYQKWMRKEYNSIDREAALINIFHRKKTVSKNRNLYKIICVGDSWTFGLGTSLGYSYPAQLERILNKENSKEYKVYNCGIPGCTSTKLLKYLPELMGKYKPDIVIILIGWNDTLFPHLSELPLLSNGPKRYYYQLENVIMDLRVCKIIRFGLDGLKRRIRVSKKQRPTIKRDVNPESIKYTQLGSELLKKDKLETARDYFEKAIDIDADNELAYAYLADLYRCLGKHEQSLLLYEKALKLNPYTTRREYIYRFLFSDYQTHNILKDRITTILENIPSDERFKNPGMPFVLTQERVSRNLKHNLEKMIALIKSKKAIPILQIYPRADSFVILKRAFSEKYDTPLVNNIKSFEKLADIKNYFGKTHPNEKGYYLMAENVYKAIKAIERSE